jgi:hypothetical protein
MERWITEDEIMHRINNHPDLTEEDKKEFLFSLHIINLSEKGKKRMNKPVIKNQERNKIKKYGIQ